MARLIIEARARAQSTIKESRVLTGTLCAPPMPLALPNCALRVADLSCDEATSAESAEIFASRLTYVSTSQGKAAGTDCSC